MNMAEISFTISPNKFHQDDCGHQEHEYLFSFVRRVRAHSGTVHPQNDHCDVYLWEQHDGHRDICIRVGTRGDYLSTHFQSFLLGSSLDHKKWDIYGITHNLIWLTQIGKYPLSKATEYLENRWYLNTEQTGGELI